MKKRAFDFLLSGTALIALSPVLAGLAVAVSVSNGGPVFFRQERVGRDGDIFRITKFKTMNDKRDADGRLLPDAQRANWFGKLMRRKGFDELPQIWDVFRGKMSFVGPRPHVPQGELSYDIPEEFEAILNCKPGITGPVQLRKVELRHSLSHAEKLALDFDYATKPFSARGDLNIIWSTATGLLRKGGGNGSPLLTHTLDFGGPNAAPQAIEVSQPQRPGPSPYSGR